MAAGSQRDPEIAIATCNTVTNTATNVTSDNTGSVILMNFFEFDAVIKSTRCISDSLAHSCNKQSLATANRIAYGFRRLQLPKSHRAGCPPSSDACASLHPPPLLEQMIFPSDFMLSIPKLMCG